ncbi:MAG: biopolymer transporter ExbD [Kiritimatiellae bacterium]|nr:biopolymer transporter ExbD [Kiritimatiellia bacterium]
MHNRTSSQKALQLPMTPMIDVVCLLLIFFLVVFNPEKVQSGLDASSTSGSGQPFPAAVGIGITAHGYTLQGLPASLQRIDSRLAHLARFDAPIPIHVTCTYDSTHSQLVKLLDTCVKNKMHTISISAPPSGR